MRVRLMQIIDYWVGVPLCFALSAFNFLLGLTGSKPAKISPKRILFIELSEMGSAILAYSALKLAQKKVPEAELYFLIFEKNRESCEILNVIPPERVIGIDAESFVRFSFSTLAVLWKLRRLGIDTAIDLELFSRCTALITYLSGATQRIGFHRSTNEGLYRGSLLTKPVPYNPHQHIALNFLTLVSALDAPENQIPLVKRSVKEDLVPLPIIDPTSRELDEIETILRRQNLNLEQKKKIIVFNPDPGDALPIRGWPLDRFVKVAEQILKDYPSSILVVIGLKRSKPYAEAMQAALGKNLCLDLTGQTQTLRSVVTLLTKSELLITNDSGPAHLAALAGVPSVVLYGPETPTLYGPLNPKAISLFANYSCSPCLSATNHRYTKCNDNLCLKAIEVQEVLAAARNLLKADYKAPSSLRVFPAAFNA